MRLILAALLLVFVAAACLPAFAEETQAPAGKSVVIDKRKLLVPPRNADGTMIVTPFLEDPVLWMREKQQDFYGRMAGAMRQIMVSSAGTAAWTLFILSFLYGVFHAAGPGHGKVVISGWLLATENELKRGILIAFMSALFQALTAIVLVSTLLLFVSGASAMAKDAAQFLESASYLMIGGMGLYLVWTAWAGHAHDHPHTEQITVDASQFELVSRPDAAAVHGGAVHLHDEHCGHAHAPTAAEVRGDWSLARALALSFAVGVRPCSGAILVLIFSYPLGLYWAGVASVLAMGFGVFLTISAIAAAAVFAKGLAAMLVGADNPAIGFIVRWGKTVVGLGIAGFGTLLFLGSLGASNLSM
jgi:nickel/cobalt transporter (NicO) family protein